MRARSTCVVWCAAPCCAVEILPALLPARERLLGGRQRLVQRAFGGLRLRELGPELRDLGAQLRELPLVALDVRVRARPAWRAPARARCVCCSRSSRVCCDGSARCG